MADLSTLRDIRVPEDPPVWPPAPGWWLVLLSIILLLILWPYIRQAVRASMARQGVLRQFRRINRDIRATSNNADTMRALAELSQLLRHVAHTRLKPHYQSTLTGDAWLTFLTQTSDSINFCDAPGCYLADAPYRSTDHVPEFDVAQLMPLVKQWLKRHA